jgi:hypothetical protein
MSGPAGEDDAVPITAELIEDTVQQILALANYEEDTGLTAKRAEIVESVIQQVGFSLDIQGQQLEMWRCYIAQTVRKQFTPSGGGGGGEGYLFSKEGLKTPGKSMAVPAPLPHGQNFIRDPGH